MTFEKKLVELSEHLDAIQETDSYDEIDSLCHKIREFPAVEVLKAWRGVESALEKLGRTVTMGQPEDVRQALLNSREALDHLKTFEVADA